MNLFLLFPFLKINLFWFHLAFWVLSIHIGTKRWIIRTPVKLFLIISKRNSFISHHYFFYYNRDLFDWNDTEPIQFIISQFKLVHTPNSDIRYNPELISKYIAFLASLKTILLSSRDVDVTNLPILKRYLQEWLSKHDSLSITSKDHPLYAKFCESLDSLNETLNQISSINDTHRIFD